jgi:hypothetical protein
MALTIDTQANMKVATYGSLNLSTSISANPTSSSSNLLKLDISSAFSYDLINSTNVKKITTNAITNSITGAITGAVSTLLGGDKFPYDLDYNRTMKINVWDTQDADYVFEGLASGTKKMANKAAAFFGESGSSAASSASSSSIMDRMGNAISETITSTIGSSVFSAGNLNISGTNIPLPTDFGNRRLSKTLIHSFYLPIPNTISENFSNVYEEKDGWIMDAAKLASKVPVFGDIGKMAATMASGGMESIAKFTGSRKIKFYENKLQMFNAQNFREISLSWTLIPHNQAEANTLQNIVKQIKAYGSPESMAGKLLIKAPNFFSLDFKGNKVLNDALRFDEVVLVSCAIDYVPGGVMELYRDGMPKAYTLSMTFRDRQPKLRRDWLKPAGDTNKPADDKNCG